MPAKQERREQAAQGSSAQSHPEPRTKPEGQPGHAAARQSMHLLRLPLLSLNPYVTELAMENPMLDVESGTASFLDSIDDLMRREESRWKEDYSGELFEKPAAFPEDGGRDRFAESISGTETLKDHLFRQLEVTKRLPEEWRAICAFLIESLDTRGYLDERVEELALCMDVSPEEAMQALYVIQDMTPAGVGARSLEECLILQLASGHQFNAYTIHIVNECLPLLAKGDLDAIAGKLGISRQEAEVWCEVVRNLNPIPGQGFSSGEKDLFTVPEAMVELRDGEFSIHYNTEALPTVTINPEYRSMMEGGGMSADTERRKDPDGEEESVRQYLREHYARAEELLHSLAFRESVLTAVIRHLLAVQRDYLLGNRPDPVPLTIAETAEALSLHAGTVSRAVKDKYIAFMQRVIPLKTLLSAPEPAGETAVSNSMVQRQIQRMIAAEDPAHPLTDADIVKAFHALNVTVSPEAVADCRAALEIPDAPLRRVR